MYVVHNFDGNKSPDVSACLLLPKLSTDRQTDKAPKEKEASKLANRKRTADKQTKRPARRQASKLALH